MSKAEQFKIALDEARAEWNKQTEEKLQGITKV